MSNVKAAAPPTDASAQILSDEAIAFVGELQQRFGARRAELLAARKQRGKPSGFLEETAEIRDGDWQVPPPRPRPRPLPRS